MYLNRPRAWDACRKTRCLTPFISAAWAMPWTSQRAALGALLLLSTLWGSDAIATDYQLIKGKQYQLCRDLLQNLKSFGPNPPLMTCGIQINPQIRSLRPLPWKAIKVEQYQLAIRTFLARWFKRKVEEGQIAGVVDKTYRALVDREKSGETLAWVAHLNFVNEAPNGTYTHQFETLLRLAIEPCDATILDSRWDIPYLMAITKQQGVPTEQLQLDDAYDRLFSAEFDAFYHDGKARVAHWDSGSWDLPDYDGPARHSILYVSEPISAGGFGWIPVCELEFLE